MKIITKGKDYFDWVVRETDPRKIFVRYDREIEKNEYLLFNKKIYGESYTRELHFLEDMSTEWRDFYRGCIWFCDKRYRYIFNRKSEEYYFEIKDVPQALLDKYPFDEKKNAPRFGLVDSPFRWLLKDQKERVSDRHFNGIEININTKIGYAIIFRSHTRSNFMTRGIIINGFLQDIQFQKVMSPTEAYTELYNWIPYIEPDLPGGPDDMYRFVEKGFDKKTSFRH